MKDQQQTIERMALLWVDLGGDAQDFRENWWSIADKIKEMIGDEDEDEGSK